MNKTWLLTLGSLPQGGSRFGRTKTSALICSRRILFTLILGFALTQGAFALTRTVTSTSDSGPGSLREALSLAGDGDTINFAVQGRILISNQVLSVTKSLKINGPGKDRLAIDAQQTTGIFVIATNKSVTISDLTLTNGNDANFNLSAAGGILNSGVLTLSNCVVTHCNSDFVAGGINNLLALTMVECVVSECSAVVAAGINNSASANLNRCTIVNCDAGSLGGGVGSSGFLLVKESTLSRNAAEDGAGGGLICSGVVIMDRSTVSDNAGFGFFEGFGGGIRAINAQLFITNSTFSANFAGGGQSGLGGALYAEDSTLFLDSCTIYSNTAASRTLLLAFAGGGIYVTNGSIVNSKNTIIAGNHSILWPPGGPSVASDFVGNLNSLGFNLVQNLDGTVLSGDTGTCLFHVDPRLGPLASNGGPTKTHALLPSSPAIDQGNTSLTVDQRNFPRPIDIVVGINPGNAADIGAYELQPTAVAIEAESGTLTSPMQIGLDPNASQGKYVFSPTANAGTASYQFTAPVTTNYVIWCRVLAANYNADSFFVSMDGGAELIYDVAENLQTNAWQWTRVIGRPSGGAINLNPRIFPLSGGVHQLVFRGRDPNTKLDRLLITSDTNFIPAIAFEAESGFLTPPMTIYSDSRASQGHYITSPTAGQGSATYVFPIPATNQYRVWCRVLATNANADSFYVSVDAGESLIYDTAEGKWTNAWQWTQLIGRSNGAPVNLTQRVFNLGQRLHSIVFQAREANSKLDRILITADPLFVPQNDFDQNYTNQIVNGFANRDLVIWLGEDIARRDRLTYAITKPPTAGTLYQFATLGRGSPITANGTPVNDPMGRVIFSPAPNVCRTNYAGFGFVAWDGIGDPALVPVVVNILSPPVMISSIHDLNNSCHFIFDGIPQANYRLLQRINLDDFSFWEEVASPVEVSQGKYQFVISPTLESSFYRVVWP